MIERANLKKMHIRVFRETRLRRTVVGGRSHLLSMQHLTVFDRVVCNKITIYHLSPYQIISRFIVQTFLRLLDLFALVQHVNNLSNISKHIVLHNS